MYLYLCHVYCSGFLQVLWAYLTCQNCALIQLCFIWLVRIWQPPGNVELSGYSLGNHELQHCNIFEDIVMKLSLGSQIPANIADFPKVRASVITRVVSVLIHSSMFGDVCFWSLKWYSFHFICNCCMNFPHVTCGCCKLRVTSFNRISTNYYVSKWFGFCYIMDSKYPEIEHISESLKRWWHYSYVYMPAWICTHICTL